MPSAHSSACSTSACVRAQFVLPVALHSYEYCWPWRSTCVSCLPHACVCVSNYFQLHYFESELALSLCAMHATSACAWATISSFVLRRAGVGALRGCHARRTTVCASNYFRLRYFDRELALVLCVCAMLATHPSACGQANVFSFTTSVEICFQLHCFVRELALAFSVCV